MQQYAPLLSKFVPGLGEAIGILSDIGSLVADGINNVYEDYTESKSNKKRYGLMDGVRSFTRQGAVKKLTKDYGGLYLRVKLKEDFETEEE
jgi:hypothetical protein